MTYDNQNAWIIGSHDNILPLTHTNTQNIYLNRLDELPIGMSHGHLAPCPCSIEEARWPQSQAERVVAEVIGRDTPMLSNGFSMPPGKFTYTVKRVNLRHILRSSRLLLFGE